MPTATPAAAATAAAPTANKAARRTLLTIFLALLIDILAFTIILPLFPRILAHYERVDGVDETSMYFSMLKVVRQFKTTIGAKGSKLDIVLFGGFLGSIFSFLQFLSSPVIGSLSDRFGRRPVLLLSMLGNALSMTLWVFSGSFTVFVLSRIVGGLTEGNVQMSVAMITDLTTPETRSRGLALVGVAFSLGFTVGPPLGAYFASLDLKEVIPSLSSWPINSYSTPALFALVLIVIETLFMAVALPETLNFKKKNAVAAKKESPEPTKEASEPSETSQTKSSSDKVVRRKGKKEASDSAVAKAEPDGDALPPVPTTYPITATPMQISALHFLFLFFFSGMEFTLTFLTHDRFNFTHAQQGLYLAGMGVVSALVQGVYVRYYAHKYVPERDIVIQGMIACAMGLAVMGLLADPPQLAKEGKHPPVGTAWLFVGALLLGFTSGTVVTSLTSLASMAAGIQAAQASGAIASQEDADSVVEGPNQGRILGTFRSLGQLGRSLGPIFACSAYWLFGSRTTYAVYAVFVLALSFVSDYLLPYAFLPSKKVKMN
ncbi:hypothetical protein HK405_011319 [Cladochytrium tenue]|nr:hypothetical protein HK405_011319 [Cladochytrium tenue]